MVESKLAKLNMAEFKMAAIIKLSQNEWVKVFFPRWQNTIWCKMAETKMAEFNIVAIIKLSQNEWVKFIFVKNGWIQDGCHHQVESEWMTLIQDGRGSIWHGSQIELVGVRVLRKMAESKMAEYKYVRLN